MTTYCIHTYLYVKVFGQAAKYFSNTGVLDSDECSTFGECLYVGMFIVKISKQIKVHIGLTMGMAHCD